MKTFSELLVSPDASYNLRMYQALEGFTAKLERVEHVPTSDAPPHRPHQFVYYIHIRNDSMRHLKIMGRKWVITNAEKHKLVVEGDGVVGEFPELGPGESYHYHSYHLLDSTSTAAGLYLAEDDEGQRVAAQLEAFKMQVPTSTDG
ncbi:MAG: ApaG domain [Verrucomicrobiota bacterium]